MAETMTVGELEEGLFSLFLREDAESWDNCGLAVGERATHVERIAFNLDMSAEAVVAAHLHGCKTLVTHHPPYIKDGPSEFGPDTQRATPGPGRMVYEAARRGVNVIAMHTNADRARAVRERYAELLGLRCTGNFEHLLDAGRSAHGTGLGALLEPEGGSLPLSEIASRCRSALGGAPRVWGDPDAPIRSLAFLNGSWGDANLYATCIANDIDCILVGETKYHMCVDAKPHLSIVDLGHDVSELPIVDVLYEAVRSLGVPQDMLVKLDCSSANWWVP